MIDILAEVEAVAKDRRNEHQGFKFRGIDDVMNMLHSLFKKHRVFMVPTVLTSEIKEKTTKSGALSNHIFLKVRYDFTAEDGSSVSSEAIGEASDSGDKASNKCMSAALKYVLLQTFCIPTEEQKDADFHSPEFVKPKQEPPDDLDMSPSPLVKNTEKTDMENYLEISKFLESNKIDEAFVLDLLVKGKVISEGHEHKSLQTLIPSVLKRVNSPKWKEAILERSKANGTTA